MNQEIARDSSTGVAKFQVSSVPFSEIPHQSRLFIEYQRDPLSLKKYYPNAAASTCDIGKYIPEVLSNFTTDRNQLCDALLEINAGFGAHGRTLENIELLRDADTVAVVTGQQAGLFTGPLYTIYKALSAIREAECLSEQGFKAIPVFWVATEDHDFEEVSKTFGIGSDGELIESKTEPTHCYENLPVGYIKLDETIRPVIKNLIESFRPTAFTDELKCLLEKTWRPDDYLGDSFAKLLMRLLGDRGLVILCPLNGKLKKLAAPLYVNAILKSAEIVEALRRRSDELVAEGYAAQVYVAEDYFPLFWQSSNNTRNALKKTARGTYVKKDGSREFTLDEMAELAAENPDHFSPSVVLRSVVQDFILPTVCYFGGAAEIAYFAQGSEVYRILGRPVTPIFHRQSFTIVESKHAKALNKYELVFADLFNGYDSLLPDIVEKYLNVDAGKIFADVEEQMNTQLNRLDQNLSHIDGSLADTLAKRRRKIIYHIGSMRHKFHNVQLRKDEVIRRQLDAMFTSLLPNRYLQERTLNVSYFINRYGLNFIDWVYESIDLEDKSHRVVYL